MNLKGQNLVEKFRQIAEQLALKIAKHDGVAGIAFAGGLERCFMDKARALSLFDCVEFEGI
jgi:hypothetical protein